MVFLVYLDYVVVMESQAHQVSVQQVQSLGLAGLPGHDGDPSLRGEC